jgi:hypothetical protein
MLEYVIVHGNLPHTDKTLPEYLAHIVYGAPEVRVTQIGLSKFVARLEYDSGIGQPADTWAAATFHRLASFNFGAQYTADRDVALREVGAWTLHYGETLTQ